MKPEEQIAALQRIYQRQVEHGATIFAKKRRAKKKIASVASDVPAEPLPLRVRSKRQTALDVARCRPRLWVMAYTDPDFAYVHYLMRAVAEHLHTLHEAAPGAYAVFRQSQRIELVENANFVSLPDDVKKLVDRARAAGLYATFLSWEIDGRWFVILFGLKRRGRWAAATAEGPLAGVASGPLPPLTKRATCA